MSEKPTKQKTYKSVQVSLTQEEYDKVLTHANVHGVSVSQWIRTKLLDLPERPADPVTISDAGLVAARAAQMFQELQDDNTISKERCRGILTALDEITTIFPYSGELLDPKEYAYPTNLAIAIFGIQTYGEFTRTFLAEDIELMPEQAKGLESALAEIGERDRDALLKYYRDGLTLGQIAEQRGCGKQWVKTNIDHGMRRLRNPIRNHQIRFGAETTSLYRLKDKLYDVRQEYEATLRDLKRLEKEVARIKKEKQKEWDDLGLNVQQRLKASQISIDELEVSVRAYNCLKRANINTIGDILELGTMEKIRSIRNLGKGTVREIVTMLHENGYFLFDNGEKITDQKE